MGYGETFGILMLIAIVVGVALVVAWIVLPFAVIGTKPLLRELLEETRHTNELLAHANELHASIEVNTRQVATKLSRPAP
jgi:hypothetical protein